MRVLFYYRGRESLGIEHLIAVLKTRGHTVDLLFDPGLGDNLFLRLPLLNRFVTEDLLVDKARRFAPDLVAVGCVTNHYAAAKRLATRVKHELGVPIAIGGVHASAVPSVVLQEECFDIVCVGEGEDAMVELAQRLENGRPFSGIRNLWTKDDQKQILPIEVRPLIPDLDSLPIADRALFHGYGALGSSPMVLTGRGCPFACTYCVNNMYQRLYGTGGLLRRRSVEHVMDELHRLVRDYRARYFFFEDDTFTHDAEWLDRFVVKYTKTIRLPFRCNTSPNTTSESVIRALKAAGCDTILMGVQSADDGVRRNLLHRHHSDERIQAAVEIVKKNKIRLTVEFIFGFPGDTPQRMLKNFELVDQLTIRADGFIFYPFPGTELAEYCVANGYLTPATYERIARTGFGSYHLTSILEGPSHDDVKKFAALLSLYSVLPPAGKSLVRSLLQWKYGLLHRILSALSIPIPTPRACWVFVFQIVAMVAKTRRRLRLTERSKVVGCAAAVPREPK
jgi:radical SAM superfamily enzyme YgiQ (UPF0313 family)